jgi:hypothetical protein
VAGILRSRGFAAITAQEAGNKGLSDNRQLEFAVSQEMAILTHDRADFEQLAKIYFEENKTHHGIIIAYPRKPHIIAGRLSTLYQSFTADEMRNQIIYI